jgi:hypothetical protein
MHQWKELFVYLKGGKIDFKNCTRKFGSISLKTHFIDCRFFELCDCTSRGIKYCYFSTCQHLNSARRLHFQPKIFQQLWGVRRYAVRGGSPSVDSAVLSPRYPALPTSRHAILFLVNVQYLLIQKEFLYNFCFPLGNLYFTRRYFTIFCTCSVNFKGVYTLKVAPSFHAMVKLGDAIKNSLGQLFPTSKCYISFSSYIHTIGIHSVKIKERCVHCQLVMT